MDAGKSIEEALELAEDDRREFQSAKIGGSPWWKAGRPIFITAYPDLDALNLEASAAVEAGYELTSIAATDGHTNVGRMAVGFWAAGPLGAALTSSRTNGHIIVVWRKQ